MTPPTRERYGDAPEHVRNVVWRRLDYLVSTAGPSMVLCWEVVESGQEASYESEVQSGSEGLS